MIIAPGSRPAHFFDCALVEREGATGNFSVSLGKLAPCGGTHNVLFQVMTGVTPIGTVPAWHSITAEEMQLLMDEMWIAGIRPSPSRSDPASKNQKSEGFNAGKVEAMQEHLADLRRMVFGVAPPEDPSGPDIPLTRDITE